MFVEKCLLSFAHSFGIFLFRVVLKSFEALRYSVQDSKYFDSIREILDIPVPIETKLHMIEQALLVSL